MRINKSDVAFKILRGIWLTIDEFKVAVKEGYFNTNFDTKDDKEFAKAYISLSGTHYNSPKRQGWICGDHVTSVIEKSPDGKPTTFCAWGIHLDELEAKHLTRENKRYLNRKFGAAKVKQLVK